MALVFHKYQGTGNDFVIIDNRNKIVEGLTGQQVALLCDRRFGIGADGLMLLNSSSKADFEMVYYNADGNLGTMCGNGGRSIVKFAYDLKVIRQDTTFLASDGLHEASVSDGIVTLKMSDVKKVSNVEGNFVLDTGSPHFVKFVSAVEKYPVFDEGKSIRYNDTYKSQGINVNFVEKLDADSIFVRTYERGVEDETYSCGTGVTASAIAATHQTGLHNIAVKTLGGSLWVKYNRNTAQHITDIWLVGPAAFVFRGEVDL